MNAMTTPSLGPPARVLELQARFGVNRSIIGREADALVFDQQLEQAATDDAIEMSPLMSPAIAVSAGPTYGGAVVDATGAIADGVPFADLFRSAGAGNGIAPSILAAVAKTESAFDVNAVSPAGAQGLMQFMPGTAAEMGVDPYDPASAIDGAARYLTQNLRRFGSLELALAAYNAGPGAVQRYGGIPPFPETQAYVRKVLAAAGHPTTSSGGSTE